MNWHLPLCCVVSNSPEKQYSDLQIISLYERTLHFIKKEFENQLGIEDDNKIFPTRAVPRGFTGKNDTGEKIYLLHDYYLRGPSPLLDHLALKHAIRNLLLTSNNTGHLKTILNPSFELAQKIIVLWNEHLQPLERIESKAVKYRRLILFDEDNYETRTYSDDLFLRFTMYKYKHYRNYNLVEFSFLTASQIASEVLEKTKTGELSKPPNAPLFNTLADIFITIEGYQESIKALRKILAIDENNKNLLGSELKGVMQVWVYILRNDRRLIKNVSDKELTILLNKEFEGLNLSNKTDGKHFRNEVNKTAKSRYRGKLLQFIR